MENTYQGSWELSYKQGSIQSLKSSLSNPARYQSYLTIELIGLVTSAKWSLAVGRSLNIILIWDTEMDELSSFTWGWWIKTASIEGQITVGCFKIKPPQLWLPPILIVYSTFCPNLLSVRETTKLVAVVEVRGDSFWPPDGSVRHGAKLRGRWVPTRSTFLWSKCQFANDA